MANDHLDMPNGSMSPSPIPPYMQDVISNVRASLDAEHAQAQSMIQQVLEPVQSTVTNLHSDAHMMLQSVAGQVDRALVPHEATADSIVQKVASNTMADILYGEAEAEQNGAHVPTMTAQQIADNLDESGESMVARVFGVRPEDQAPVQTAVATCWLGYDMPVPCDTPGASPIRPLPGQKPGQPAPPLPVSPPPIDTFPPISPPPPPPPPPCECVSPPPPPPPCGCAPPPPVCEPPAPPPPPPNSPPAPPPAPPDAPGVCEPGGEFWVADDSEEGGHCEVPPPDVPLPPDEPPLPPPPAPPPDGVVLPAGSEPAAPVPLFRDANVCQVLQDNFDKYKNLYQRPETATDQRSNVVSDTLRLAQSYANTLVDELFSSRVGFDAEKTIGQSYTLAGDWLGGYSQALTVFDLLDKRFLPYPDTAFSLAFVIGAAHKAESTSGMPLDYLTTPVQYLFKAANPQYILDQPELDQAYIRGLLTSQQWNCYTTMHGNIAELRKPLVETLRPIPTPDQVAVLENRGGPVASLAEGWWTQHGLVDESQRFPYRVMATFVPGPGDLVRFMVRDSFDDAVVKSGQLDKDFDLKFYGPGGKLNPGRAAAWAKAQGMTEDQFRYFWYAHWEYPSNTALYEMLHRLRPDRPAVTQWDGLASAVGKDEATKQLGARPLVLTLDDIRNIVEINDMAPGMIDPLLAVSYHPINRTDGISAYLSGAFSEDQLYHCFRDNGYDEPTARTMVSIQVTASARRNNNLTGLWSIKDTIKAYQEGLIDGVRADLFLQPLMPNVNERVKALQLADLQIVAINNRAWLKQIKREYVFGATNDEQCVKRLTDFGVTARRAADLNDTWRADRMGRFREPTAKQVLGWLTYGIINAPDCFSRLDQLGFQKPDIDRMITQAIIGWGERVEGKIEKSQKEVDKLNKSMKDVKKETDEELASRKAALESRIKALQATLDRVHKEELDRGVPFE